jgi:hypothetical protein
MEPNNKTNRCLVQMPNNRQNNRRQHKSRVSNKLVVLEQDDRLRKIRLKPILLNNNRENRLNKQSQILVKTSFL